MDVAVLAAEFLAAFDLGPEAVIGIVELALQADEAGDDDASGAEGGENTGMGFKGDLMYGPAGGEQAGDEDAKQVDLGGEIVGRHLIQQPALVLLEGGGIEAVFPGVSVATGGATFVGSHRRLTVGS